jgi:hypothetical protein
MTVNERRDGCACRKCNRQLQWSVALSVIEAEFFEASEGAKEQPWPKRLLGEHGGKGSEVPTLFVDNARAAKIAKNAAFTKR